MAVILEENEVVKLMDDGAFYVLEDKTQVHRPIVEQGHTETWKNLYVDWAFTDSGQRVAVRYYWPKSEFELVLAKHAFHTLTKARRKELARLRELYLEG